MDICTSLNKIKTFKKSILTIGVFDGLHLGHMKIIEKTSKLALSKNLPSVLITFHPHPKKILTKNNNLNLLIEQDDKLKILANNCIDYVLIIPFSLQFSNILPENFLNNYIIKYFNPKEIIIGYDHRFGYKQKGDLKFLEEKSTIYNFTVHSINAYKRNDKVVSSTKIRKYISSGKIKDANLLLGYDYFLNGIVIKGDGRGSKMKFPTANIKPINNDKLIPKNGVYCVDVEIYKNKYIGMCNIGYRPTFYDNEKISIEVHLITDDKISIKNKKIKIIFKEYIREEKKYENINDLILQLNKDRYLCQSI